MKKKIIAVCLALMLIVSALPVAALAASTGTVKTETSGGSLNLRSGPSTTHDILGWVQDGDAITVNFQGTEWSNITVNKTGKSGYIKNKYVVLSGSSSSSSGSIIWGSGSSSSDSTSSSSSSTAYVYVSANGGSLCVRAGQSTSTAINGYVQHGDAVTVLSTGSEWTKITNKSGKTGYIKTKYLRVNPLGTAGSSIPWAPSTPSASVTSYDAAVVMTKTVGGQVNIRTGAGASNASICTVGRGTFLKVTGTSGDWVKVTLNDGKSGYIHKNYVSYGVKATTTASRLNLRKGAGTSYGVQTVLNKGTSIVVLSVSGNWAKVTAGSKTGYVSTNYIKY